MNANNLPPPFAVVHQNKDGQAVTSKNCASMAEVHAAVTAIAAARVLKAGDRLFIDYWTPPERGEV